ncbi:hypothetical protein SKC41_29660 [Mycobacterium sp. 050128]|uniref:hypothetical protein n=1 Tax=Mycobacterium sp. 050128 TaxID=3096112 RepID=UPI002EDA90C7
MLGYAVGIGYKLDAVPVLCAADRHGAGAPQNCSRFCDLTVGTGEHERYEIPWVIVKAPRIIGTGEVVQVEVQSPIRWYEEPAQQVGGVRLADDLVRFAAQQSR